MIVTYSHDIATATLAVSGISLWILWLQVRNNGTGNARQYEGTYLSMTRLAKYSLIWILVAGVPRTFFYKEYEWASQAGDLQVVAIIIKHIVMFLLVGIGLFFSARISRKLKQTIVQQQGG